MTRELCAHSLPLLHTVRLPVIFSSDNRCILKITILPVQPQNFAKDIPENWIPSVITASQYGTEECSESVKGLGGRQECC